MVQDVLPDLRGTRTVKAHGRKRRARDREEEETVHSREHRDHQRNRDAEREAERHDGAGRRALAREQRAHEEKHEGEEPRSLSGEITGEFHEEALIRADKGVSEPGNTENGADRHDTRTERGALRRDIEIHVAEGNHQGGTREHHHLDHERHADRLSVDRAEFREEARKDDEEHAEEEDPDGELGTLRERLIRNRFRRLNEASLQAALILRIVLQFLAPEHVDEAAGENADQAGGERHHQDRGKRHLSVAVGREKAEQSRGSR